MLSSAFHCFARAPRCKPYISFRSFTSTVSKAQVLPKTKPRAAPGAVRPVERSPIERVNANAFRMLEAGRDEIYRNTAATGFLFSAYSIMILSYSGIGYIYSTRLWDIENTKKMGLAWFVPVGYQFCMVSWGVLAAFSLSRTFGLIKSLRLVRNAGKVQLEASIHRPIPFMRPEKVLADPSALIVNRPKFYGAVNSDGMIVAAEGQSIVTRVTRNLFYKPFHNIRKVMGGVGLVKIQVGESGSQRHCILDVDGEFSNGGKDLLELSKDEF